MKNYLSLIFIVYTLTQITIDNVTKRFGNITALNNINLEIGPGQIYGILGPNGSGKTTLLKIISGILDQDSGSVKINDLDTRRDNIDVKRLIGYIPETPALYESLTPMEYFSFIASVFNIDRDSIIERVRAFASALEIESYLDNFIGSLSFGTKQKVAIISAFIHDPEIIVMDEGMNGLDPRSSKIIKDLLRDFASRGKTVIFSTHILEIAEAVCDYISILYKGNIVASGTMTELKKMAGMENNNLEEIFLKVTGDENIGNLINSLRESIDK
ncbi:ABC-2 type transport system ATP-binding protein [Picrophilus oshimae DSM 9789]|uniref:ABC-2 type transport system ATP-binding protein n=1 Tax=Picrophilus torridus (strain ATCC 700027 / DSM 9790 / JCM 10055 / NBRC 100828 / KAW 2/3) TaxID=1122961 RepID=A0A8G2FY96_PICTO|nr:ABC-2 type transport system ATP-binding protein [Picrophilus oshimae DSM 9789]